MIQRLATVLAALVLSNAVDAKPCTIDTMQEAVGDETWLILRNEECANSDRRVVKVFLERESGPPRLLLRRTQRMSLTPGGGGKFIDLGHDGVPGIELIGYHKKPNLEYDLYELAKDHKSMDHFFTGGAYSITKTSNYLVTASRGTHRSWKYLAYDLATTTQRYPTGDGFQYSIYVKAIENPAAGEVLKSKCIISRMDAAKKLAIDDSPPTELLDFCESYGKNYVLAKSKHARKKWRVAP